MKKISIVAIASLLAVGGTAVAHEPSKQSAKIELRNSVVVKSQSSLVQKPADHSGGTDARGCHTNSQTGVYHCHQPK